MTAWTEQQSTELERVIASAQVAGSSLQDQVSMCIDSQSGLMYQRLCREFEPTFTPVQGFPADEWIEETVEKLVRSEFGSRTKFLDRPPDLRIVDTTHVDVDDLTFQYLERCEQDLVFNGAAYEIAQEHSGDPVRGLYELLCHPLIGNTQNRRNVDYADFYGRVAPKVRARERLLFIFPGFPFKDQNPFRTLNDAGSPDFAEYALLIRLHALATAIFAVYQLGSDWLILSDGSAFAKSLRVGNDALASYQRKIVQMRNRLDIGRSVHMVDYLSLTHIVEPSKGYWDSLMEYVLSRLRVLTSEPVKQSLRTLRIGMKRNVCLRDVFSDINRTSQWRVIYGDRDSVPIVDRPVWDEVDKICANSAVEYATFSVASKWVGLDKFPFPSSIRATVHPKPGQIAVPRIGSEFPWNGTAVMTAERLAVDSLSCASVREIAKQEKGVISYIDDGGSTMFVAYAP